MLYTINLSQDRSTKNRYLSTTLLDKIQENIDNNNKIILYLNKRGAFSSLICQDCSYLFECPHCDTSLSVHHNPHALVCHLCGNREEYQITCKNCKGSNLKQVGVGTQQIEKTLQEFFPKCSVYRFDSDSVQTKTSKKQALKSLHQADIIIGTKMITTGFDFENVGLIGVILLEQELSFPQYNIEEKVYTNIKQLLGRGERNGKKTDFIIQTFIPENPFVKHITQGNYKDFFTATLQDRKTFMYPPFAEMATLEYRDNSKIKAGNFLQMFYNKISSLESSKDLDIQLVDIPFKRNNQYHYKIIIKGNSIQKLLADIQPEIMRNSKLSLVVD